MQDRVPLYPGRVMLTPVPGQENTFDMVRADSPTQEGTPLNKATLLKDATAAMLGLGDTAVPDDAFALLGKYNLHWWRRRTVTCVYRYDKVVTSQTQTTVSELASSVPSATLVVNRDTNTGSSAVARNFSYAYSIEIDQSTGEVKLVNPTSIFFKVGYSNGFKETEGNYFTNIYENPTAVYRGYASVSYGVKQVGGFYYQYLKSGVEVITSEKVLDHYTDFGDWEYVTSISKETYPENGYLNGYVYEYLGIPFDNAVTSPKVEIVEYTGTGTYGSSNPNTLTFSRVPEIVFFKDGGNKYGIRAYAWGDTQFAGLVGNSNYYLIASVEGTTMTWYVGGTGSSVATADTQMNVSGQKYKAIAVCR